MITTKGSVGIDGLVFQIPFNPTEAGQILQLNRHAHWLPRLALAGVFLYHGIGKLLTLQAFAMMMMIPVWVAAIVAVAELGGALLLLAGGSRLPKPLIADRLTRLGAAMFAPVLVGAIAMLHWGQWSFVASGTHPMGGMEFQVLLLSIALYFVIRGNEA